MHFIKREEVDPELPAALAARLIAAADGEGRYALDAAELARLSGGGHDRLRALLGHLARAQVILPSPSSPDRVAGRLSERGFDRRAAVACRASVEDGARSRWRQYREIWAYVEERRSAAAAPARSCATSATRREPGERPEGAACCDVCDEGLAPELPPPSLEAVADLDDAIMSVARSARPAVGRTTCAEILHGARTKKIERNSYDGLPAYGTSAQMRRADILARVDELIDAGVIRTSGGPYPVLQAA